MPRNAVPKPIFNHLLFLKISLFKPYASHSAMDDTQFTMSVSLELMTSNSARMRLAPTTSSPSWREDIV